MIKPKTWTGCYNDSWKGLIVPEAFSHPAKFSPGLIKRIYEHGFEKGYWKPGDTISDPFGGIGAGGIFAAPMGLIWIGVELEEKFVRLADKYDCPGLSKKEWVRWLNRVSRNKDLCPACQGKNLAGMYKGDGKIPEIEPHHFTGNFELHRHAWETMGYPMPVMVQGDSRRFSEIVKTEIAGILTSPPFVGITPTTGDPNYAWKFHGNQSEYSKDPSNIGNLPVGRVDAICTSPPFSEPGSQPAGNMPSCPVRSKVKKMGLEKKPGKEYGSTSGQIGKESGETYWSEMLKIFIECFKALKPGGVIVVVIKNYIKKGQIVPLCDQTHELMVRVGFTPLERIRAMLVSETRENGLFGEIVKKKERKSFFRRLAEKKGSPAIDWEEVLFLRRSLTGPDISNVGEIFIER